MTTSKYWVDRVLDEADAELDYAQFPDGIDREKVKRLIRLDAEEGSGALDTEDLTPLLRAAQAWLNSTDS